VEAGRQELESSGKEADKRRYIEEKEHGIEESWTAIPVNTGEDDAWNKQTHSMTLCSGYGPRSRMHEKSPAQGVHYQASSFGPEGAIKS
jgi:hypothetical protein